MYIYVYLCIFMYIYVYLFIYVLYYTLLKLYSFNIRIMNKSTMRLCILLICILLICIIYLFYKIYIKSQYIDSFEADPESTPSATPEITALSVPTRAAQCTSNDNITEFCMNYDGCCDKNVSVGKGCFCNHRYVLNCKSEYDNCTGADCKDKLKQCCTDYNKIDIDDNNFKQPIMQTQTSNQICSLNMINNIEQKCMELCQTNTDCKAYNVDNLHCTLFNEINPLPVNPKKPNSSSAKYIIKK